MINRIVNINLRSILSNKIFKRSSLSCLYSSSSYKFNSLDRLLRTKPAIIHSDIEEELDGVPDPTDFDDSDLIDNDEPDPGYRLGKQLLKFGKVHYRHISPLPEWFLKKQDEICR